MKDQDLLRLAGFLAMLLEQALEQRAQAPNPMVEDLFANDGSVRVMPPWMPYGGG